MIFLIVASLFALIVGSPDGQRIGNLADPLVANYGSGLRAAADAGSARATDDQPRSQTCRSPA
jgi:hypothetical protein